MEGVWNLPFNETIDSIIGNKEVCVVGVFGKSTWGHTTKSGIINVLSKSFEFSSSFHDSSRVNVEDV